MEKSCKHSTLKKAHVENLVAGNKYLYQCEECKQYFTSISVTLITKGKRKYTVIGE